MMEMLPLLYGTLRLLFERRRYDKEGHRFITYEGEDDPF